MLPARERHKRNPSLRSAFALIVILPTVIEASWYKKVESGLGKPFAGVHEAWDQSGATDFVSERWKEAEQSPLGKRLGAIANMASSLDRILSPRLEESPSLILVDPQELRVRGVDPIYYVNGIWTTHVAAKLEAKALAGQIVMGSSPVNGFRPTAKRKTGSDPSAPRPKFIPGIPQSWTIAVSEATNAANQRGDLNSSGRRS